MDKLLAIGATLVQRFDAMMNSPMATALFSKPVWIDGVSIRAMICQL
jgi:hypothetical protein